MRLTEKTERYSIGNKRFVGRKKNYTVNVNFSAKNFLDGTEYWWYFIKREDVRYSYNSTWDGLKYNTKEECVAACEDKIDELSKQK